MKVWIVSGQTESADNIGPYAFAKKPTDEQLRALAEWGARRWMWE